MQCNVFELMGCAASSLDSDGRNKGRNIEINGKSRLKVTYVTKESAASFWQGVEWPLFRLNVMYAFHTISFCSVCFTSNHNETPQSLVDLGGAPEPHFSWFHKVLENVGKYMVQPLPIRGILDPSWRLKMCTFLPLQTTSLWKYSKIVFVSFCVTL